MRRVRLYAVGGLEKRVRKAILGLYAMWMRPTSEVVIRLYIAILGAISRFDPVWSGCRT
jgi:hypothetical protein